jgi:hypothetical protein
MSASDRDGAIDGLLAEVGAHRASATARVRLGEVQLRDPPDPERALGWFDRALALHDAGCSLAERDLCSLQDLPVYNWFRLNGVLNVHAEYGYLVNKITASVICEWLKSVDADS